MYIATKILLTYLASLTAPDLCDVVNSRTGTPTVCQPHADGAPVYDADVCCTSSGSCVAATGSSCSTGRQRFYCELGERNATGSVSCYFEVPSYCEVYECDDELEIDAPPQEGEVLCCPPGQSCTFYSPTQGNCEITDLLYCESVVANEDGTVDCLDE